MNNNKITHCQNCGAPATTEVCRYCKGASGIDKEFIKLEYPVLECDETNIIYHYIIGYTLLGLFLFPFGLYGMVFYIKLKQVELTFIGFLFALMGFLNLNYGLTPVIRNLILKKHGKEIDAIVYGYMDDDFIVNGYPTQIAKLLIDTKHGKKFILYQLEKAKQPYKIKSKIKIKMYKNIYKVLDKEKVYF